MVRPDAPRRSKARDALERYFAGQDGFVTTTEVHLAVAREIPSLSRTTVHRILRTLTLAGTLDVARDRRGVTAYRRCRRRDGHSHLFCTGCDLVLEVDPPPVAELREAAWRAGSTDITVTVVLTGLCSGCGDRSAVSPAPAPRR